MTSVCDVIVRRMRHIVSAVICGFALLGAGSADAATSLSGSTGYLYVPRADVAPSETWAFGGLITDPQGFPARQAPMFSGSKRPDYYFSGYVTVGYLPRLEITVRGNGMPGTAPPGENVGKFYRDGMASFQLVAHRGGGRVPSIGIGIQDFFGFMLFNAAYLVATWEMPTNSGDHMTFTVGWVVDWYNKNIGTEDDYYPPHHTMSGPVAAMEIPLLSRLAVLAEYDSRAFNTGLRARPFRWVTVDVAAVRCGLDQFARGRVRGFAAHVSFNGAF